MTPPPVEEPSRDAIDRSRGPLLLEFGASWCGHCQRIAPAVAQLLLDFPEVKHLWIEDGPGRPLGRSFRVKLWPTFVLLRDGIVLERLVRPDEAELRRAVLMLAQRD